MHTYTVDGKIASRQQAEDQFLAWSREHGADAELLKLCPHGAPIILGDLMYVLEEGLSILPGRDAYRAVVARAGIALSAPSPTVIALTKRALEVLDFYPEQDREVRALVADGEAAKVRAYPEPYIAADAAEGDGPGEEHDAWAAKTRAAFAALADAIEAEAQA